jgi:hypothetical protein
MISKNGITTKVEESQYIRINKKGVLDKKDNRGLTDWFRVYREGCDQKYGVYMYSPTLDVFRHTTPEEFYNDRLINY